jgi:diaminohydroxyphosphoribosylaminopyrimidine deaminase/5-amino-6-(5-phosphoribosylamino)uracil reductase
MTNTTDIDAMRQCFRLAMLGRGRVEPNPMVGCVIQRNGEILSEAFHDANGGPHAEAAALAKIGQNAQGATAFVNLEPCVAFDKKRTPACSQSLIAAGVKRVVVGCLDPNPNVSGRGVAALREAGIEVAPLVLQAEAKQFNAAFFKSVQQRWPYVTLKWAQSANGKIAGDVGERVQISNSESMRVTHELRSRCDAILVGIGTVLADDPLLTARRVLTTRKLTRVVLDTRLRLPLESRLARTAMEFPTLIFAGMAALKERQEYAQRLANLGVEVVGIESDPSGRVSIHSALDALGKRDTTHLLVEPGPQLAAGFLEQNLADRAWVFGSQQAIEGADCPSAPRVNWTRGAHTECIAGSVELNTDVLKEYLNPNGSAYFCLAESADLMRAREK